jgi:predicted amidohydrolase YtcJ
MPPGGRSTLTRSANRAARVALDAVAAARGANGDADRRHTIAHLQLVQWATRDTFTLDALQPYIGPERFARLYPARSLQDAGAALSGGSDWPVDPLNPFNQIETAVTRVGAYAEEPEPLGADQALERHSVLRMHTAGSAFQMHCDDSSTLEPGKRGDVIVLDRDITTSPADEIKSATVRYTFVGGELVHDADSSSAPASTGGFRGRGGRSGLSTVYRHVSCCGARPPHG